MKEEGRGNKKGKTLESWLWDAACSIRGAKDAPKFKDFILPRVYVKRLCDVFDSEDCQCLNARADPNLFFESFFKQFVTILILMNWSDGVIEYWGKEKPIVKHFITPIVH